MDTNRLEAFSDGCIAIFITIMVLELRPPAGGELKDLVSLLPTFASYALSFVMLGIYWGNHHHLLHATKRVSGSILWANLGFLFCLSLVSFASTWMGLHIFSAEAVAFYGFVLLICIASYINLQHRILRKQAELLTDDEDCVLEEALGTRRKEALAVISYIVGIILALAFPPLEIVSLILFAGVAILWLIPDKRIERLF